MVCGAASALMGFGAVCAVNAAKAVPLSPYWLAEYLLVFGALMLAAGFRMLRRAQTDEAATHAAHHEIDLRAQDSGAEGHVREDRDTPCWSRW